MRLIRLKKFLTAETPFGFMALLGAMSLAGMMIKNATVLGVIPLLQEVFWVGLAITIMAGLTFGTLLTMILLPVLYGILFAVPSPARG